MPRLRSQVAVALLLGCVLLPALGAQRIDTVRVLLRWEVAEGVHPTADSLGKLSGIAVDTAGFVYVSDVADSRVWVFSPAGTSVGSIGRKGRGPGEFDAPSGVAIAPDGALYVRDVIHISRFIRDPRTGRLTAFDRSFRGPVFADWKSLFATRFDRNRHLYLPQFNCAGRCQGPGSYHRYTLEGERRDSLVVPSLPDAPAATAWVRLDATGGRVLPGLNHVPFAPLPVWDVTPRGTLLVGDGASYVIKEYDAGGRIVREYRRNVAPQRIPERERRDSLAALAARLDSVTVPWSQVVGVPENVRARQLPEHYPAYLGLYAAGDGRIWIRRWVPDDASRSVFDVFEADGTFRQVVELPRRVAVQPAPVFSSRGIVAVGVDPETGAHTVLSFGPPVRR